MTRALVVVLLVAACGDTSGPNASPGDAAADLDAPMHPAPPVLGEQLDRAGRPQIRTLLVGALDGDAARQEARRAAYDRASDPGRWAAEVLDPTTEPPTTIEAELARNLAILDALDTGHVEVTPDGCGNVFGFEGPPSAASYRELARLLADDQLYLDTEKTVCAHHLAVELATMLELQPTSCGGRAPTHDAIDATYSLLFGGTAGFTPPPELAPRIGDGASSHHDVSDTAFPFLGAPR